MNYDDALGPIAGSVPDVCVDQNTCSTSSQAPSEDRVGSNDPALVDRIEDCLDLIEEVWPSELQTDEPGPRQLGRFTIVRELGRGGFGVVFLAEDPALGRQVALKVPRIEVLSRGESWRQFLREARAAARLDHPNLVPILEAGAAGPVGYIASVYVDGPSLADWLRGRDEAVTPRFAARLVSALARAMEHVHQRDILHRDLKPANVLLHTGERIGSGDGSEPAVGARDGLPFVPRICDFGLAKLLDVEGDESRTMLAAGSPSYMAPEQAESRKDRIGPATDVYGLGAILYELLTGRPPFGGKNQLETLQRVIADEPVAPRRRRPGVPRDLETICLKCLAKRPEARYHRAADLEDDLESFLELRPIRARRAPLPERAGKWCRRHPALASSLTVALFAVVIGLCGLLQYQATLRRALARAEKGESEALEQKGRAEKGESEALEQKGRADERERLTRRQLEGNQVRQAQQAIDSGQLEFALALLDRASSARDPVEAPGFAWSYLDRIIRDRIQVFTGRSVTSVAFSPDGRFLASADDGRVVRLADLSAGRGRELQPRHVLARPHLDFSPDGRWLASSWAGPSLETLLRAVLDGRFPDRIAAIGIHRIRVFFSSDGSGLIGLRSGTPASEELLFYSAIPRDPASPLGRAEPATIDRLERLGLRELRLQPMAELLAGMRTDGERAASDIGRLLRGSRPRGIAFVTGSPFVLIGHGDGIFEVIRSQNGASLVLGEIREQGVVLIRVDMRMGDPPLDSSGRALLDRFIGLFPPAPRTDPAEVGAYSQATHRVARYHKASETLAVIDTHTGKEHARYRHGPLFGLDHFTFSADGHALAFTAENRLVRVWHLDPPRDPEPLRGHATDEAWSLAFAPDNSTLASAGDDHAIRLWDSRSGRPLRVLSGHPSLVTSIAYSPKGRLLASGDFDNMVRLWDVAKGACIATLTGHQDKVRAVAFSPDGRTLASGGDDHTVRLWDVVTGRSERDPLIGHSGRVTALAFQPGGRILVSGSLDKTIRLCDVDTGEFQTIESGGHVYSLAISPDGRRLASSHEYGSVKIWDVETRALILTLMGHSGHAYAVTFSPDGRSLVSCGTDQTVRVWDPATGQELLSLTGHQRRVNAVAFSPDGHTLASADHTGAIRLWRDQPAP